MNRREFITLLGGAAAWPLAARAQQPAMPVIGYLSVRSAETDNFLSAFRQGLAEMGFVEGRNVAIEFRWADGRSDRLPALAAELVARRVHVIAAGGGPAGAVAAKAATNTIPIVFTGGSDPVAAGLVASLNRPGGNATGVLNIASELTAKRLEVVRELAPAATVIGALRNPEYPEAEAQVREIEAAARHIGLALHLATASRESDFTPALAGLMWHRPGSLLIANDPFFAAQRKRLTALVADHRVPAIYSQREYAEAGGLMSYGTNFADLYRQVGAYTGRILKGEKPADLPVMQPTRFELVINLKTAKALGLEIPPTLLARADEVIE
jgi:putative tryptophan/tyrosine transport system substrate-binding protein